MVRGADCYCSRSALVTHTRVALDVVRADQRSVKQVNIRAFMAERYCCNEYAVFANHVPGSYLARRECLSKCQTFLKISREGIRTYQYGAVRCSKFQTKIIITKKTTGI